MTVTAVVGGSMGSEGKGAVVGHIAGGFQVHVRVGAANAGHTVYVGGEKHVLQQLPCAAYANPHAKLVLGAGAMISPEIMREEIVHNAAWRERNEHPPLQLYVDHRAHVVTAEHIRQEQETDLAERIGSTSAVAKEGIGAAQAARVMRTGYALVSELSGYWGGQQVHVIDTVKSLHEAKTLGMSILLEGTQGTGLSNTTGFYPYVTSRNITATGLLADCGLGPKDVDEVILVARTFPIRVAGNSGPFYPDSREIDWQALGVDPDRERTTVTKKVRRVATFSYEQIKEAVLLNSATEIALTFCDYLEPGLYGRAGVVSAAEADEFDYVAPTVRRIESLTGVPVTLLGTGPDTILEREPDIERSATVG